MTVTQAQQIRDGFAEKSVPSEEDCFRFTEAMEFLIAQRHDPRDMMYLGGWYYGERQFDLALEYYEMAAACEYEPAWSGLGYIWYYGRTGERDYAKALHYFTLSAEKGNLQSAYKVADLYKNGYGVEKDYDRYCEIMEELYPKVSGARNLFAPLPEIYTRLAGIREKQGRIEEAIDLYLDARDFLAQRIRYDDFFGNLNIMKWLIGDLYLLMEFDYEDFDLFDLFYLLQKPVSVRFSCGELQHTVSSELIDGGCAVCFDGKWFRGTDEFFAGARIGKERLTALAHELNSFELVP